MGSAIRPFPLLADRSSAVLRVLFALFWFLLFGAFLAWVLWGLPPRERHDDDDPGDLPLTV